VSKIATEATGRGSQKIGCQDSIHPTVSALREGFKARREFNQMSAKKVPQLRKRNEASIGNQRMLDGQGRESETQTTGLATVR